jgi:hypothetical protein
LLANRKAVVSEIEPGMVVDDDIKDCIQFAQRFDVLARCCDLARDDIRRATVEEEGFNIISRRDIRVILKAALDA